MIAWDEFLVELETKLGKGTVARWLRPLKVVRFDAANIYLEAEDSFQKAWFDEQVRSIAEKELRNPNGRQIKIHLTVSNQEERPKEKEKRPFQQTFRLQKEELDPHCTFEGLYLHSGIELAHKLLSQLGQEVELASFNPIYLHGPEGAGRSHLLMACASRLQSLGLQVLYTRAQTFTDNVIHAIRAGEMQLFRKFYRGADVLLIDDVQVFSRKGATQEELFHTFNQLHVSGKQLILASDCAPGELKAVEPRLVSRFEWGVVLPIDLPQPKALRQILESKAKALNFPLTSEILALLLEHFSRAPKRAARALEALVLRSHLDNISTDHPLHITQAKSYLVDLIEEEKKAEVTPNKIVEAVAQHYGINSTDILGKSQKKEISLPRQIAMYLCRKHLRLPFTRIGDVFERDHSTVMTSVKRIETEVTKQKSESGAHVHAILKSL